MERSWYFTQEEKELCDIFVKELATYKEKGVSITLGGKKIPLFCLAIICLFVERGAYMGDYIFDDKGRLMEIKFDRVRFGD